MKKVSLDETYELELEVVAAEEHGDDFGLVVLGLEGLTDEAFRERRKARRAARQRWER